MNSEQLRGARCVKGCVLPPYILSFPTLYFIFSKCNGKIILRNILNCEGVNRGHNINTQIYANSFKSLKTVNKPFKETGWGQQEV